MKLTDRQMKMIREMGQMDETITVKGYKMSVFQDNDFDEDFPEYDVYGVEPSSGLRRVEFRITDGESNGIIAPDWISEMEAVWYNRV
jgi:hypothetical protein